MALSHACGMPLKRIVMYNNGNNHNDDTREYNNCKTWGVSGGFGSATPQYRRVMSRAISERFSVSMYSYPPGSAHTSLPFLRGEKEVFCNDFILFCLFYTYILFILFYNPILFYFTIILYFIVVFHFTIIVFLLYNRYNLYRYCKL